MSIEHGFWFLICNAATQLALQLHLGRIQVVRFFFFLFVHTASAPGCLVFGLLCRHTLTNPITTEMHTSGVQ